MTTVGLISDTHGRLPQAALDGLAGCDRIIHAGDIGGPQILWELEGIAPVCAVLGNNDHEDYGPSVNAVASPLIDGVRFVIVHEPRHLRHALKEAAERHPDDACPVIGVYGHRHIPHLETSPESLDCDLLISPGAVFRSRDELGRRCIGIIEVDDGRIESATVRTLTGDVIYQA